VTNNSEIFNPIIAGVSVDMIYLSIGPRTVNVGPNYAMLQFEIAEDEHNSISIITRMTNSNISRVPTPTLPTDQMP